MIAQMLAARRLTQLITEDEIAKPLREPILAWGERHSEGSWQDRIAYLVSCPACTSVWSAGAILVASRTPYVRHLVTVLALSQATLVIDAWVKSKEAQH